MLALISENIERLIDDQFGNYVVQHTLQYGMNEQRTVIIQLVKRRGILQASSQKYVGPSERDTGRNETMRRERWKRGGEATSNIGRRFCDEE